MAYISHQFGRTHFTRKGSGKGIPIVWLHGGPGGTHRPDANVFRLAQGRKVYCYTQIGSGKSSPTNKKYWNIRTFVEELAILIDEWGLEKFHLMGGSWGTTLALEYYLRKRGKGVVSLVFQSPLFNSADWKKDGQRLIRGLPKETQKVIRYCHEIGATDAAVYQDAMMVYYGKHVLRNKKKLQAMFTRKNPDGAKIYQHMWGPSEFEPTGTLKSYDRIKDLGRIKVPALIICGEHDEATPQTGIRYANQITGASFAEIGNASHAIWDERPAVIEKVINGFLSEVEMT